MGLFAYTIWQALPGQRANPRQRALGWWIALSTVLNGMWLVLAQFATLLLTVVGIVALLIVLSIIFRIAVLVVGGLIGVAIAWFSRGSIAPALALTWGISWLAVGRLSVEPLSTGIGITAIVVAVVVLLAAVITRVTRGRVPSS